MNFRRLFVILTSFLGAFPAAGDSLPAATFTTQIGMQGRCLGRLRGAGSVTLQRHGIKVRNGRQGEGRSVLPGSGTDARLSNSAARVLQRIESLGGASILASARGTTLWSVPDLSVQARQISQGIAVHGANAGNVAMIAHELGHKVGNSRGWYARYNKALPQPCQVSTYCTANHGFGERNEEFAEVFAAFVTHPQLLQRGSPACRSAYEFLRKEMFAGRHSHCAAMGGKDDIEGDLEGPVDPSCVDPDQKKNRRDLRDVSRHLEAAAHIEDNDAILEGPVEEKEKASASGFGASLQSFGGVAVQFMPVLMTYLQARQQQKQIESMYPNLLITPPVSTVTPYQTILNSPTPAPTVAPIDAPPDSGAISPSTTGP